MNSHPDPQQVIDDLGDKFLNAFVAAVDGAREDLGEFRGLKPEWFINFSKRFVANFIHERVWDRMVRATHDHDGVTVIDREPTRQIHLGGYEIRFKRHRPDLKISSYPTPGALAFWTNSAIPLPGMEMYSLALGYIWDASTGEITDTIVSYRVDKNTPLWSVVLETEADESGVTRITQTPIDPTIPQIDLGDLFEGEADGTNEGS